MPGPYLIAPDPAAPRLTRAVTGLDHDGRAVETRVVEERPLTIFLNAQEIVTAMTIGDYPGVEIAGYLSPRQTVVAGPVDGVEALIAAATES